MSDPTIVAAAPAATPTPTAPPRPAPTPTWRPVPPPAPTRTPRTPRTRHWTDIPERTPSRRAAPTRGLTPAARGGVVAGAVGVPALGGFAAGFVQSLWPLLILAVAVGAVVLVRALVSLVLWLLGGDSQ